MSYYDDMDEENEVHAIQIDDDLVEDQEQKEEQEQFERYQSQKVAYVRQIKTFDKISTNLKLGSIEQKINQLLETAEKYASFLLTRHKQVQRLTQVQDKGRHRVILDDEEEEEILPQYNGFTRLNKQPKLLQCGDLKDYQLTGLNWIISLYETGINGILADEMGLGKTIQTIAFFAYLKEQKKIGGPHLVVAPKSTLGNWMREFKKWLPSCRVVKLIAVKEERDELISKYLQPGRFDVCLTSYEGVNICLNDLRRFTFKYIVVDEAHKIKNEEAMVSQNMRRIKCNNKLLLTGTPLQNTPHELWSLLNYLLPDLFDSSDVFDKWFEVNVESKTQNGDRISQEQLERSNLEMVQKFHKILRPFMLRRTKAEVEKFLPPKKEIHLFVKMTSSQRQMYQNIIVSNNPTEGSEAKHFYHNKLMQLRKICLHPYLFPEVEDKTLPALGEHLIDQCGKLRVLDKLLNKLSQGKHQVLIFSQFTMMLNILEDYCNYREFLYCRIDGDTEIQKRDDQIADFSSLGSTKYVFLLSTRAGGLGINLASADTVIIYDSDFNPQMDLQAMDRAHRIGQVNQVMVYRIVCEHTVEEKIIERQQIKLRWDSLMIQQGRMHQKGSRLLSKDELKEITQYGASQIFKIETEEIKDEDIDLLLQRGEERTQEMNQRINERFSTIKDKNLDLGLGQINIFDYFEENKKTKDDEDALDEAMALQMLLDNKSRRDKKPHPGNLFKTQPNHHTKKPVISGKKIILLEHNLYRNRERLQSLLQKEEDHLTYQRVIKNSTIHFEKEEEHSHEIDEGGLSVDERAEVKDLIVTGFPTWSRQEFSDLLVGSERYGRNNIQAIQELIKTKTLDEVKSYKAALWSRGINDLTDREKILKSVEKGEKMLNQRTEGQRLVEEKCKHFHSPRYEMVFTPQLYNKVRSKFFSLENDKYLIFMSNEVGYGNLTALKKCIRKEGIFKFDHAFKSKNENELKNRITTLLRVLEKEKENFCLGRPVQSTRQPIEKPKVLQNGKSSNHPSILSAEVIEHLQNQISGVVVDMKPKSKLTEVTPRRRPVIKREAEPTLKQDAEHRPQQDLEKLKVTEQPKTQPQPLGELEKIKKRVKLSGVQN